MMSSELRHKRGFEKVNGQLFHIKQTNKKGNSLKALSYWDVKDQVLGQEVNPPATASGAGGNMSAILELRSTFIHYVLEKKM